VIRSFRDAEAKKLFGDEFSKQYQSIERPARKRLLALDNAESLLDLAAIPGNHLECLKGDRKGQYSIRINDQFRVCFVWQEPDALNVEITDYH
jgi:toxin HigB-1